MVMAIISTSGCLSKLDLSDFISSELAEPIGRVTGVGSVQVFGSEYAMRIWLDPSALTNYGLTVADVSAAIEAQNAQVTAGQLGGLPAVEGQQIGRAHICTPVTNAHLVCRLLLEKKKNTKYHRSAQQTTAKRKHTLRM